MPRSMRVSEANLDIQNITFKNEGTSASIKLNPEVFKTFFNLVKNIYSGPTFCDIHQKDYIYQVTPVRSKGSKSDESPSTIKVHTYELVGKSPELLATLTLYSSTHLVHIQGTEENIRSYIITHFNPLIELYKSTDKDDLLRIRCVDCATPIQQVQVPKPIISPAKLILSPSKYTPLLTDNFNPVPSTPVRDTVNKSVRIPEERETTLLNGCLNRVQTMEDIIAENKRVQNEQGNRIKELKQLMEDMIARQTKEVDSKNKMEELVKENSGLKARISSFEEQLISLKKELDSKANCKCKCTVTETPIKDNFSDQDLENRAPYVDSSDLFVTIDNEVNFSGVNNSSVNDQPASTVQPNIGANLSDNDESRTNVEPNSVINRSVEIVEESKTLSQLISKPLNPDTENLIIGDSNLRRTEELLYRRLKGGTTIIHKSGATYKDMIELVNTIDNCNVLCIQGGSNSIRVSDPYHVTCARADLEELICLAIGKASRVILIPPPPTTPALIAMETMIHDLAKMYSIESMTIHHYFTYNDLYFSKTDKKHPTKCGSGVYGWVIASYLAQNTELIKDKNAITCTFCHRTGHSLHQCRKRLRSRW